MPDAEKKLRISIESDLKDEGLEQALDKLEQIQGQSKDSSKQFEQVTSTYQKAGSAAIQFLGTIGKLAFASAGAVAPLMETAQRYVAAVNMANTTSRQWLQTQYQIEQSELRLGKINAEKTLPLLKLYSSAMERITTFAEKNKQMYFGLEVAAGALGSSAILELLLGALGKLGLIGATTAAGAVGPGAVATGTMTAASAAGAGGATGAGAAGVMGAVAGTFATIGLPTLIASGAIKLLMNYLVNQTSWGRNLTIESKKRTDLTEEQYAQANRSQNPSITAAMLQAQNQGTFKDTTPKWMQDLNTWMRTVLGGGSVGKAPERAKPGSEFLETETLQRLKNFQRELLYAEQDYNRQRFVSTRDFNRQLTYNEEDFGRQRAIANRNFNIDMAFTEKMFYLQRSIAQREFTISLNRSEQDYAISRRRAAEDYNFSLKQIMLNGDALAYYYAQRQYNISKQRAEEDYQLQRKRAIEDFNRQQADSLYMYGLERAQRLIQFNLQMKDQETQYQVSRKRSLEEFNIRLSDMEYNYQLERTRRWQSFENEILPEIVTENEYRALMERSLTTTMVNDFNRLMSRFVSDWEGFLGGNVGGTGRDYGGGGYANGGYTRAGMAMLHNREFVLTPSTTRAAEEAARGSLTQEKILDLLTQGGNGLQYIDNRQFSRGLAPEEKVSLRQDLEQMIVEAYGR